MKLKLFITGFFQVFLVTINTYFIFKEFFIGVFFGSLTISLIWSWNVKRIAFGSFKDRLYYSLGAGVGSILGLILSKFFFNMF
jgi:hypothetical protein